MRACIFKYSLIGLLFFSACSEPIPDQGGLSGPYLGQPPPGEIAEIFAPGLISTGLHDDAGPSFTRDGKEVLFRIAGNPYGIIGTMKEQGGIWSGPVLASYSGNYPDGISDFSNDGNWIVFSSRRPVLGEGPPSEKSNLWMVTRNQNGWDGPKLLPSPISTEEFDEYMASLADDGTLYFTRRKQTDEGPFFETFRSRYIGGSFQPPEKVEIPIDPGLMTIGGFVAPDGNYMLMSIRGHPEGFGEEDLFVTFKDQKGSWGVPINLGPDINSDDTDWMPRVTRDGKFLFFVSWRYQGETWSNENRTYEELIALKSGPKYGWGADIYWVSASMIEKLRPFDEN